MCRRSLAVRIPSSNTPISTFLTVSAWGKTWRSRWLSPTSGSRMETRWAEHECKSFHVHVSKLENVLHIAVSQVTQLYLHWLDSGIPAPVRQLVGVNRTHIATGSSVKVSNNHICSQQGSSFVTTLACTMSDDVHCSPGSDVSVDRSLDPVCWEDAAHGWWTATWTGYGFPFQCPGCLLHRQLLKRHRGRRRILKLYFNMCVFCWVVVCSQSCLDIWLKGCVG